MSKKCTACASWYASELWLPCVVQGDKLLPLSFQVLDDDYFAETRELACRTLELIVSHSQAQMPPCLTAVQHTSLLAEMQKRLDDASNAVRIAACSTLSTCAVCLTVADSEALVHAIAVHMDDADVAVREAVCRVMVSAASRHPEAVSSAVQAVCSRHQHRTHVETVLAVCTKS